LCCKKYATLYESACISAKKNCLALGLDAAILAGVLKNFLIYATQCMFLIITIVINDIFTFFLHTDK